MLFSYTRYSSRCILVEFFDPPIVMGVREYMKFTALLKNCSSCVGVCIGLAKKFFDTGIDEVDQHIIPKLQSMVKEVIHPRVMLSYAMLLWFSLQVSLIRQDL